MPQAKEPRAVIEELGPDEPLFFQAWMDCLLWASGFEPIVTQFREDTGIEWNPAVSPIDRMIDETTGANAATAERFIRWFHENVWGEQKHKEK